MSHKGNSQKKKIYIACGGSAGHIFPGLTLAGELAKHYGREVEISFLTSGNKLALSLLDESGFSFHALSLGSQMGMNAGRGGKAGLLGFIAGLFRGTLESTKILLSDRPDCFVGFGSYIAGPAFVIASLTGIPTIIHEQNVVTGKANRIMRTFATKVALSFPEETGHKKNVVFTGNPIRDSASKICQKSSARDYLGISHDRFTILVSGGSQGSRAINSSTIKVFSRMEAELRNKIQIIHLSGESDYEEVKRAYGEAGILSKVFPFFKDMSVIYSASDISVSRAGASAVCELAIHGLPSILIPYPFAGGHQVKNAGFFKERKAAIVIEQESLPEEFLGKEIRRLMEDAWLRRTMGERIRKLAVFNAGKKLAGEVYSLL